jgi:DNA (cytosine-5)-methyltransferase 1
MGVGQGDMRLLDLFCGAGGAAVGYSRAGFTEIVGVDNKPQPRYPFTFVQADALEYLEAHGREFEAIHASPVCKGISTLAALHPHRRYPEQIKPLRHLFQSMSIPYVIENVRAGVLVSPVMVCGTMFDPPMAVRRHRFFESNVEMAPPTWPCRHKLRGPMFKVYEHYKWRSVRFLPVYGVGGRHKADKHWAEAMGIDWMKREELTQAIPPAYTEYIGQQLLRQGVTACLT